jgi:uncharacterized protein (TIGR03067 family)
MNSAFFGIALALTGLAAHAAIAQNSSAATSDSARLQGKFVLVGGTQWGRPLTSSQLANSYRTTVGDQLTVVLGGELLLKATVRMKPSSRPKQMDYQVTGGSNAGGRFAGLYQIHGDTVLLCFAMVNEPRPKALATGPEQTLFTWVRARP